VCSMPHSRDERPEAILPAGTTALVAELDELVGIARDRANQIPSVPELLHRVNALATQVAVCRIELEAQARRISELESDLAQLRNGRPS
jgi:hypothetical protein